MHKYRLISKKGEGTFSEVLKAQCIKNGKYVAIKCMKNHFSSLEQVNNLREIQALRRLSPHPNIIKLIEVLYDQPTGRLALVFELMEMNIYEQIRGRRTYLAEQRVKHLMYQLMKSMDHMHRNGIFHRDIKPENVLIAEEGLKLADFGSCRGIYSKQPYTEYISTRWYRAPECLLTDGYYSYKMDMWGVGCVFFEVVSLFPLFPGTNELDQIQKIHNVLGTPPPDLLAKFKRLSSHIDFNFPPKEGTGIAKLIPHASPDCVELIMKLLAYNPDDRLSARQALRHTYFRELRDAEKRVHSSITSPPATSGGDSNPAASMTINLGGADMTGTFAAPKKSSKDKSEFDRSGVLPTIGRKGEDSLETSDDGQQTIMVVNGAGGPFGHVPHSNSMHSIPSSALPSNGAVNTSQHGSYTGENSHAEPELTNEDFPDDGLVSSSLPVIPAGTAVNSAVVSSTYSTFSGHASTGAMAAGGGQMVGGGMGISLPSSNNATAAPSKGSSLPPIAGKGAMTKDQAMQKQQQQAKESRQHKAAYHDLASYSKLKQATGVVLPPANPIPQKKNSVYHLEELEVC
mmetsp:Transcript_4312/g.6634  ORF Transcript_4312/g.6634 Transcript_4312/m.6634 type:complete len:571 (-) Transcript_4312:7-1719(-)